MCSLRRRWLPLGIMSALAAFALVTMSLVPSVRIGSTVAFGAVAKPVVPARPVEAAGLCTAEIGSRTPAVLDRAAAPASPCSLPGAGVGISATAAATTTATTATTTTAASDQQPVTTLDPDAYPWAHLGRRADLVDGHGYFADECTSFAAWAIRADGLHHEKSPDFQGDAAQWAGAEVDAEPHVGDIAQWDPWRSRSQARGHVAYVAGVDPDGGVRIYEYNWGARHGLTTATVDASLVSRFLRY